MKIKIKKLSLLNFKGIRKLAIDFEGDVTNIYGKNGAGKSSCFDAFTWLLFGKNSQDKKDFNIKTLDNNNQEIPQIDHEVSGVLEVDGSEIELKRIFREKWVKQRGKLEAEFQGNETLYYWNDVPVSQKEYKDKIESICSEDVFKMITSPSAFTSLNWKDQRKMLFDMAGEVSDQDIAEGNEDFKLLLDRITGKSFEEFKKESAAKKKKLNDELKAIPTRIDEINRNMPDPVDEAANRKMIEDLNKEVDKLDAEISDRSKANEAVLKHREELQNEVYSLRAKIQELQFADKQAYQKKVNEANSVRDMIEVDIDHTTESISSKKRELENINNQIIAAHDEVKNLREEWFKLNSSELKFNDEEFKCPACKREFEAEDIEAKKEELTKNFNRDKLQKIAQIDQKGKEKKEHVEALQKKADVLNGEIESLKAKLSELKGRFENEAEKEVSVQPVENPQIAELNERINKLQEQLNAPREDNGSSELVAKKRELNDRIQALKSELQVNEQIKKSEARIEELQAEAKHLGQEVANLERDEFTMAEFTKKKIEMIEGKINAMFTLVDFKLYNTLINGGEEETCIAMIDGVPFSDLNTASQINCGLDIISGLIEHYGVRATIFTDRAESVSELLPTESQLIRLLVKAPCWIVTIPGTEVEFEFKTEGEAREIAAQTGGEVSFYDGSLKVKNVLETESVGV